MSNCPNFVLEDGRVLIPSSCSFYKFVMLMAGE